MSVYSYIEVVEPKYKHRKDDDLLLGLKRGISWEYQIAVSGGSYLYQPTGVTNDLNLEQQAETYAKLIFEQHIDFSLRNYHEATMACKAVLRLDLPELNQCVQEDLDCLLAAQDWFVNAYSRLPNGIVRLDWCEYVWGWDELALYKFSALPNQQLQFFRDMAVDTKQFKKNLIAEKAFVKKYKRNNNLDI